MTEIIARNEIQREERQEYRSERDIH